MKINENFSGKSPRGDSGQLPFDFVGSWNCSISYVPLKSCPPLSGFQHIPLRQDTRHVISNITLRRHGLLQRLARAWEKSLLLFQTAEMKTAESLPKAKIKKPDVGGKAKDEEVCRTEKRWWTKLAPFTVAGPASAREDKRRILHLTSIRNLTAG